VQRGEVWWAELPPPAGRRPVLLLSRNRAYRVRTSITFAVIARTVRHIPVEVPLGPEDGLPAPCAVNADDILTAPKALLKERIASLSREKMAAVAEAVTFALGLE
jgi:mRNA interferase MazF